MKSLIFTNDNCVGCNKCIKTCACMRANIADKQVAPAFMTNYLKEYESVLGGKKIWE